MPDRSKRTRAGRHRVLGRRLAADLALRLGRALREARLALGITQQAVAGRAGISQTMVSKMERGQGASASLETWAAVAASVDERLAAFLEAAPSADRPRDYEHLRLQRLVVDLARDGGWRVLPEDAIDPASRRSRSVDVTLIRDATREAAVTECTNHVDDVGAAWRALDGKVASVERHLSAGRTVDAAPWSVRGVWIVRGTRRNLALASEFRSLFAARYAQAPEHWLRALGDPVVRLPTGNGLLFTDAKASAFASPRSRDMHRQSSRPGAADRGAGDRAPNAS